METTPPIGGADAPADTAQSAANKEAGQSLNKLVVARIKGKLREQDRTYESFAPTVGLSRGTFAQRMAGNTPISVPELGAIAQALDVDPADLV